MREIIMFMDIHCIQQVPPSNINRDDTGSPKTAYVGGALRSRVSSQDWKRAMRGVFGDMLDSSKLGKRTKGVVTLIADSITSKRPDLAESAEGLAQKVMAAAGFKVKASDRAGADKGSLATDYLIFIANNEIDKLADLAIAAFDEGEDVSKMKKEVSAIFHGPQAVDIALFGRMLADAPDLNTDASAQVAHAFSIDQITPEYDYFTAVDDCASEDNAGAAMIDTVGFNSSTLYRYATVNIDVLRDQLQDDSATVEGVVAFVEAFVKSMPSGKQNTFANHTLPEDVVVTLRESQPISAADAFEDPVRRKDGISVSRQGVERLGERLNDIRVNYGEEPVKAWYVATGGAVSSLNEWCEQVSLPDLEQSLKETLNAAYSA
ncbi:type I-E CRISPR-associated protein Cas7/Cse4/CasC [Bifidobacterium adolescentis]|nr:type I-E CRISPR-associated protein Cas7/Cse4/CasC [Bifidobacterium adolescentis]